MKRAATTWALLILSSPILILLGGAIIALCVSTSASEFQKELHNPVVQSALWLSLKTTLISLVIIAFCGTALALLISRKRGLFGSALELLITLPAIMPPSVAGIALLLAFGRRGLIGSYLDQHGITFGFSMIAVVMAQTFVSTPFYVREAATAFQSVDPSVRDAARLDGADSFQMLRSVTLPITAPFLITGALLAWARALSEFGATILFAGSLQNVTQTLPIAIYIGFETDLSQAKAIALILLASAAALLLLLKVALRRSLVYAH